MKRPHSSATTTGLACTATVTGGTAATTVADDLPEPYAALGLVCVTALAVTVVRRIVQRLLDTERELASERAARQVLEREYGILAEDFNALALEHAERTISQLPNPEHDHGPRCTCRQRGPRPYLSLVDEPQRRQGSA